MVSLSLMVLSGSPPRPVNNDGTERGAGKLGCLRADGDSTQPKGTNNAANVNVCAVSAIRFDENPAMGAGGVKINPVLIVSGLHCVVVVVG